MHSQASIHPRKSRFRRAQGLQRSLALLMLLASTALLPLPAHSQSDKPAAPGPSESASVNVARLDSVWLQPEREAPASVVARNESRLSAEASGVLLRWTSDVGAHVKRGDLLAQIDPRDAELSLQRARAALDASNARLKLAEAQLARSRELVAQGFFSQEALAQRATEVSLLRSEINANRAQFATAKRQLDKTSLRAPFDGSIKQRLAQNGEAVMPGSVLFVLIEDGAAEIEATLSPTDVQGLKAASQLRFDTAQGSHAVRLLRVARTLSTPARTQIARLDFLDPASAAPAGSSGSLRWVESRPHIPPHLLVRRGGLLGLFVMEGSGNSAKARFVRLSEAQEGRASPLPKSLTAQTPVIVRGQAALKNGQRIEAREQ